MWQKIENNDTHSLINPKPLLAQTDHFIAKAHADGDILLELYLIAVKGQFEQISKQECVCFFNCRCEDSMRNNPQYPNDASLLVRIYYATDDPKFKICTYAFTLVCREQAKDMCESVPLNKGDWIRVVGRFRTNTWVDDYNERRWRMYVETKHVELIKRAWSNDIRGKVI